MAEQPYPPAYDNREGTGRFRRRGFDRLLDRLMRRRSMPEMRKMPSGEATEEMQRQQRNPAHRRRMLEEMERD